MGGQEGNRGYLYQAITSIIEACGNEYWDGISVETNTENDKIDIALYCADEIKSAIQVKSSINQFSKSNIENWILQMITDVDADSYKLVLIGNFAPTANDFVVSIRKFYQNMNLDNKAKSVLQSFLPVLEHHRIQIDILPFNEEHLISIIRDKLNRFLSSKGYNISFESVDEIANVLISKSFFWATDGKIVNRYEYINQMLNLINNTNHIQNSNLVIGGFDFNNFAIVKMACLCQLIIKIKLENYDRN